MASSSPRNNGTIWLPSGWFGPQPSVSVGPPSLGFRRGILDLRLLVAVAVSLNSAVGVSWTFAVRVSWTSAVGVSWTSVSVLKNKIVNCIYYYKQQVGKNIIIPKSKAHYPIVVKWVKDITWDVQFYSKIPYFVYMTEITTSASQFSPNLLMN